MLKELVVSSRSFRSFDESKVFTAKELEELVDAARLVPSAANRQPWQSDRSKQSFVWIGCYVDNTCRFYQFQQIGRCVL